MDTSGILVAGAEFELVDKCRGCMLGILIGDALGATVEGFPSAEIATLAAANGCGHSEGGFPLLDRYIKSIHMGTVTPLRTEIGYRWANEVHDENFVSQGPNPNPVFEPFLRAGELTVGALTTPTL